jgi:hypothetical protein
MTVELYQEASGDGDRSVYPRPTKSRPGRISVKWKFSRLLVELLWHAWQDFGSYNGTSRGPTTLYELALRERLRASRQIRWDIAAVGTECRSCPGHVR